MVDSLTWQRRAHTMMDVRRRMPWISWRALGFVGGTGVIVGAEAVHGSKIGSAPCQPQRPCPAATGSGGSRGRAAREVTSAGGVQDLRAHRMGPGSRTGDNRAGKVGCPFPDQAP